MGKGPVGPGFGLTKGEVCVRLGHIDDEMDAAYDAGASADGIRRWRRIHSRLVALFDDTKLPSLRRELSFQANYVGGASRQLQKPNPPALLGLEIVRSTEQLGAYYWGRSAETPPEHNVCASTM